MPEQTDPYLVLGVARAATKAQIKAAHRTLAKRYHPDAETGDARRFRDVHEAYQLLADPLRRREWDARHAPGPIRADEAPRPARRRRTAAASEGSAGQSGMHQGAAHTYRWSASEVPWWEEGASSSSRRQPGARRPKAAEQAPPADPPPPTSRTTADFEVYNRSSGAAWSSAARQYFRRFDADLPKHGQFRRQGTQPLTAARARVAAEEEARAQTRQSSAPPPTPPPAAAPAAPPRPQYAYAAGVAHSAEQVSAARAATARQIRAAGWPRLRERLLAALLAWIPFALIVGYGGAAATGCDHALATCPQWFEPAQTVAIALILGGLVAAPRIAFVFAVGSLALAAAGAVIAAALALSGIEPPLPRPVVMTTMATLSAIYLIALTVVALNRRLLPWVGRP